VDFASGLLNFELVGTVTNLVTLKDEAVVCFEQYGEVRFFIVPVIVVEKGEADE
jgi:hypothetical protein